MYERGEVVREVLVCLTISRNEDWSSQLWAQFMQLRKETC